MKRNFCWEFRSRLEFRISLKGPRFLSIERMVKGKRKIVLTRGARKKQSSPSDPGDGYG